MIGRYAVPLVALLLVLMFAVVTSASSGYRYYGVRVQRGPVTVQLDQAHVTSGHVAVWFGANDYYGDWTQGGIAQLAGSSPFVYIETARHNHPVLYVWPAQLGQRADVSVVSHGGEYQVRIDGHRSRWVWLRGGRVIDSTLETYGTATGVAKVNQQSISTP